MTIYAIVVPSCNFHYVTKNIMQRGESGPSGPDFGDVCYQLVNRKYSGEKGSRKHPEGWTCLPAY